MDDSGAVIHGNGLAKCFSAHGQTGNKCRHQQLQQPGPERLHPHHGPGRDDSGRRAGNNTADITHHIIAERRHPFGTAQHPDGNHSLRHFLRSHGMKGLLIGCRHGHDDDVKDHSQKNNGQQNYKGYRQPTSGERLIGNQRHGCGDSNGNAENGGNPLPIRLNADFFRSLLAAALHTIPPKTK